MHECNETRCYGWQDNRKMQKKLWKTVHARGSWQIEKLSSFYRDETQKSWWIENLSRMCRADREHKILARWIDLSFEKLSRSNPKISIEEVSVEKLSRMQKRGFSRGKTRKMRKQQDGYSNKHPSNMLSTQTTLQTLDVKHS